MKGIVLAGGLGTRLYPVTRVVSKHLLPIYDKPMVFYPLSSLMLAGIRNILLISTPQDLPMYQALLGDGAELGLSLRYEEQPTAGGIAQAFIIGRSFVGSDSVTLILGDNIFYGQGLSGLFQKAVAENKGATIFGYVVKDPERYGVPEFDKEGRLVAIVEKPKEPRSSYAITGLYVYDNQVLDIAAGLKPSARGELEITDVNSEYLRRGKLRLMKFGRGVAWLDTGTPDALLETAQYFAAIERRQKFKVACLEEVAYRMGYIDVAQLRKLAERYTGEYRTYLQDVASESPHALEE
ncbi:MAG TPA: glucose-1-phosphate thymidylyltransferase RfbA [Candidatus Dormibacteraeota bacterium]|nr:glucose-1-phosphate thymidylyltransferase RfbA [Candidatus Dormibacteraeota bacterium]